MADVTGDIHKAAHRTGGFLKEFEEFIARGNVIDLAVAVIIGAAFGKVIDSLVNDVIMPPIGILIGGVNFSTYQDPWVIDVTA